jgi:hypothetical protein
LGGDLVIAAAPIASLCFRLGRRAGAVNLHFIEQRNDFTEKPNHPPTSQIIKHLNNTISQGRIALKGRAQLAHHFFVAFAQRAQHMNNIHEWNRTQTFNALSALPEFEGVVVISVCQFSAQLLRDKLLLIFFSDV